MARDALVVWAFIFGFLGALDVIRKIAMGISDWWGGLSTGAQLILVIIVFIFISKKK